LIVISEKNKAEKSSVPKKKSSKKSVKKEKAKKADKEEVKETAAVEDGWDFSKPMEMAPVMRYEYRAVLAEWQAAAAESRLATAHATAERSKPEHQYLLKLLKVLPY